MDYGLLLTCIGRLFAMVKLGMGGSALQVFVSAESGLPSIDPEVKDTVDGDGEKKYMWLRISKMKKAGLIIVKQCMREVAPYLTG